MVGRKDKESRFTPERSRTKVLAEAAEGWGKQVR